MVTILVELRFDEENRDEAKRLLNELAELSSLEEGCEFYDLKQGFADENTFILYEVFTDREAQEVHKTMKHYKEILLDKIIPMVIERNVRFFKEIY